jgi:plastocyanin
MKKLLIVLAMLSLVTVLTVACGSSGGASSSNSGNAVHMGDTTFMPPSVTISKGSSINLINDTATVHIISNGSWVNGSPRPASETGAPTVSNLQISSAGESHTIGPFNTAGTYHYYCSVHTDMNLTVTVQ